MAVESELFWSGIYDLEFNSSAHPCRHISSVVAHKELPNGIFCKSRWPDWLGNFEEKKITVNTNIQVGGDDLTVANPDDCQGWGWGVMRLLPAQSGPNWLWVSSAGWIEWEGRHRFPLLWGNWKYSYCWPGSRPFHCTDQICCTVIWICFLALKGFWMEEVELHSPLSSRQECNCATSGLFSWFDLYCCSNQVA